MSTGYPQTLIAIKSANTTVGNTAQKVLFIGQKVASGTATAETLIEDIQNDNSWDSLFGPNSMLAGMIRSARKYNPISQFDAIALDDDGSAVFATSTIEFTGTAIANGDITIDIVSSKDYSFKLSLVDTDTASNAATKLETLINANVNIPVTASSSTGTVTLTADNGGTEANSFALSYKGNVNGISIAITSFVDGENNPSTANITDLIGNTRYQSIVSPLAYGTQYMTDFLEPRFNVTNNILDGTVFVTQVDSIADIKSSVSAKNNKTLVTFANIKADRDDLKGSVYVEAPYVISSYFASIRALRLTDGSDISEYVVTNSALDVFGGVATASLPYFNTPLNQLIPCKPSLLPMDNEIEELTTAGASTFTNNITNTNVIFGEIVTTYKTDVAGNQDISFKYLNYVDTAVSAREYMFNNSKKDFVQSRLTDGDLIAYRSINNAQSIKAKYVGYYSILSGATYMLTQAGSSPLQFYKDKLNVTVDISTGTATVLQEVPIVTQLRNIVSTFELTFNI